MWRELSLDPREFLRRWCLHVLPKGFTRVRHYGYLSAAAVEKLGQIRNILQMPEPSTPLRAPAVGPQCECCKNPMLIVHHASAQWSLPAVCQQSGRTLAGRCNHSGKCRHQRVADCGSVLKSAGFVVGARLHAHARESSARPNIMAAKAIHLSPGGLRQTSSVPPNRRR